MILPDSFEFTCPSPGNIKYSAKGNGTNYKVTWRGRGGEDYSSFYTSDEISSRLRSGCWVMRAPWAAVLTVPAAIDQYTAACQAFEAAQLALEKAKAAVEDARNDLRDALDGEA